MHGDCSPNTGKPDTQTPSTQNLAPDSWQLDDGEQDAQTDSTSTNQNNESPLLAHLPQGSTARRWWLGLAAKRVAGALHASKGREPATACWCTKSTRGLSTKAAPCLAPKPACCRDARIVNHGSGTCFSLDLNRDVPWGALETALCCAI